MKRKSSPIPPGVTILHTDLVEFHLDEKRLHGLYWWRPDFNNALVMKVKFASVLSYKASNSSIENNKGYLSRKWIQGMELEDQRTKGIIYDWNNQSPYSKQTVNITVQQVPNDPIQGIKVLGVDSYLGNKEEVLVLLPNDLLYIMDMTMFVEAVARGRIVDGVFQDDFIWASNGSRFNLIRKDSPYHESLMKTEN